MDISYWTNLTPIVKIVDTKKKFYNQYFYKVLVYAPGCKLITEQLDRGVDDSFRDRIQRMEQRSRNWGGSWFNDGAFQEMKLHTRIDQLVYYRNLKEQHKNLIKYRTEKDSISIYCDDEDLLYGIAANDPYKRIKEIHRPRDEEEKAILARGESIVVNIEHSHKVLIRPWLHISHQTADQLYNYLSSMGDQVVLTRGLKDFFNSKNQHNSRMTGNLYFYTSDPDIVIFLQMICPRFVTGIYKLAKVAR